MLRILPVSCWWGSYESQKPKGQERTIEQCCCCNWVGLILPHAWGLSGLFTNESRWVCEVAELIAWLDIKAFWRWPLILALFSTIWWWNLVMNADFLSFVSLSPGIHSTVNLIMLRLIFLSVLFLVQMPRTILKRSALRAVIIKMSPAAPDNRHRAVQPKAKERDTVSAGEKPSCHPHWQQWSGQVVTGKSSAGQKDDWGICEWP